MEIQTGASATPGFSSEVQRVSPAPAADAVNRAAWSLTTPQLLPLAATAVAFSILFARPFELLVRDWWTMPEAGHGLLLAPVAIWLAWRSGIDADSKPARAFGIILLVLAVLIRCASGLAAELFTMRGSMVVALAGLTLYQFGFRQLIRWWLPFALICLSIPLPELVTQTLALPLQFKASQMGAALLEMRNVPVVLTGNVIHLPGRELFVTEACSGLRSLTALLSMAVLLGALVLRTPVARLLLLFLAIPVAIVINGLRVFLTGFLVFFVSPSFGEGFMHLTEGWLLFLVSMSILASVAWVSAAIEKLAARRSAPVSQAEVAHA
jgi:exosortase